MATNAVVQRVQRRQRAGVRVELPLQEPASVLVPCQLIDVAHDVRQRPPRAIEPELVKKWGAGPRGGQSGAPAAARAIATPTRRHEAVVLVHHAAAPATGSAAAAARSSTATPAAPETSLPHSSHLNPRPRAAKVHLKIQALLLLRVALHGTAGVTGSEEARVHAPALWRAATHQRCHEGRMRTAGGGGTVVWRVTTGAAEAVGLLLLLHAGQLGGEQLHGEYRVGRREGLRGREMLGHRGDARGPTIGGATAHGRTIGIVDRHIRIRLREGRELQ